MTITFEYKGSDMAKQQHVSAKELHRRLRKASIAAWCEVLDSIPDELRSDIPSVTCEIETDSPDYYEVSIRVSRTDRSEMLPRSSEWHDEA